VYRLRTSLHVHSRFCLSWPKDFGAQEDTSCPWPLESKSPISPVPPKRAGKSLNSPWHPQTRAKCPHKNRPKRPPFRKEGWCYENCGHPDRVGTGTCLHLSEGHISFQAPPQKGRESGVVPMPTISQDRSLSTHPRRQTPPLKPPRDRPYKGFS
jgi:hypothetical protein